LRARKAPPPPSHHPPRTTAAQEALPHDVVVDAYGKAWYSIDGCAFIGELDPKTRQGDRTFALLRCLMAGGAAKGHARPRD